jgi:hypothetical protein
MKKTKRAPLKVPKAEPVPVKLDLGCGKRPKEGFIGIDSLDFGQDFICDLGAKVWYPKFSQKPEKGKIVGNYIPDYLQGSAKGLVGLTSLTFKADSVDEAHSSHFVEHLDWPQRVNFFNELYRIMKVGATATIVTPHWTNACFYGDPTHKAPLSEWYVNYLNKDWRATEAPHTGYTCDFTMTNMVGTTDNRLAGRNPEYMRMAMGEQINAWRDLVVTLTKR